jgi:hypothetical protein
VVGGRLRDVVRLHAHEDHGAGDALEDEAEVLGLSQKLSRNETAPIPRAAAPPA